MDAVAEFLRRIPHEIASVGGSLPWRVGALVLVLVLNLGFYLPSLPAGTPGAGMPGLDKLVHLVVFALTVWAAGRLLAPRRRFPMGWIVLIAFLHGVFIELVQLALLPERGAESADVLFDVIGIALGLGLWIGERLRSGGMDAGMPTDEEQPHAASPAGGPPQGDPDSADQQVDHPVREERRDDEPHRDLHGDPHRDELVGSRAPEDRDA